MDPFQESLGIVILVHFSKDHDARGVEFAETTQGHRGIEWNKSSRLGLHR
jgi:hypothetical protein